MYHTVELGDRIVQWLAPPDPSQNHDRARALCQANTGRWFLESTSFETWKTQNNSLLWLHGIPGCGKTILGSTVIQSVLDQYHGQPGIAVAYFYFDFNDKRKQGLSHLIFSLLAQLSRQSRTLSKPLRSWYESSRNSRQPPTLEEAQNSLTNLISEYEQTYVLLDALDESTDCEELGKFLEAIKINSSNVHVLATSRKEWRLEAFLRNIVTESVEIQNSEVDADIRKHLEHELINDSFLSK